MVLTILVPHFPALGSGGMPPVPPTILMSDSDMRIGERGPPNGAITITSGAICIWTAPRMYTISTYKHAVQ